MGKGGGGRQETRVLSYKQDHSSVLCCLFLAWRVCIIFSQTKSDKFSLLLGDAVLHPFRLLLLLLLPPVLLLALSTGRGRGSAAAAAAAAASLAPLRRGGLAARVQL